MTGPEAAAALGRARVGVFGYVMRSGRPNACAVTPYVVDGAPVVTSTLALVDKASAVRRDPRVVLAGGGVAVSGRGTVAVDTTSRWFDRHVRSQELVKYPPARSILGIPGHRRLFGWYVGRVVISIEVDAVAVRPGDDRATVTVLDASGSLHTVPIDWPIDWPIDRPDDLGAAALELAVPIPDGQGVVLIHEEDAAMTDLRQLTLHGQVMNGVLTVDRVRGSLEPTPSGLRRQLATSRLLARQARANRTRLSSWPTLGS